MSKFLLQNKAIPQDRKEYLWNAYVYPCLHWGYSKAIPAQFDQVAVIEMVDELYTRIEELEKEVERLEDENLELLNGKND